MQVLPVAQADAPCESSDLLSSRQLAVNVKLGVKMPEDQNVVLCVSSPTARQGSRMHAACQGAIHTGLPCTVGSRPGGGEGGGGGKAD